MRWPPAWSPTPATSGNTHAAFLDFLKLVAKAHPPQVKLHIVNDNYATHKHPEVKAWRERTLRVTMQFTLPWGSWMNLVEIFFGIITRQGIRRGRFTSVKELINAIEVFIDGCNDRCEPFVSTKASLNPGGSFPRVPFPNVCSLSAVGSTSHSHGLKGVTCSVTESWSPGERDSSVAICASDCSTTVPRCSCWTTSAPEPQRTWLI